MSTTIKKEPAIKAYLRENGRKGGEKTKLRGSAYFAEIGRKGLNKRWKNIKSASFGPGRCRKCGVHIEGKLAYLQSKEDMTLCNHCE